MCFISSIWHRWPSEARGVIINYVSGWNGDNEDNTVR